MKTTVDLPDELYRRAKAEAALRGRKFRELVAEGLVRVLEAPAEQLPKAKLSTLMKRARGVMDSDIPTWQAIRSISRASAAMSVIV